MHCVLGRKPYCSTEPVLTRKWLWKSLFLRYKHKLLMISVLGCFCSELYLSSRTMSGKFQTSNNKLRNAKCKHVSWLPTPGHHGSSRCWLTWRASTQLTPSLFTDWQSYSRGDSCIRQGPLEEHKQERGCFFPRGFIILASIIDWAIQKCLSEYVERMRTWWLLSLWC